MDFSALDRQGSDEQAETRDLAKVASEALRKGVAEGASDRVSVIVEVGTPAPQVEVGQVEYRGHEAWVPRRVVPAKEADSTEASDAMSRVHEFLRELLDQEPVWLNASKAFVVDASGDEIYEICRCPLVRAIYPNRRLA